jgi:hypothetical protein
LSLKVKTELDLLPGFPVLMNQGLVGRGSGRLEIGILLGRVVAVVGLKTELGDQGVWRKWF